MIDKDKHEIKAMLMRVENYVRAFIGDVREPGKDQHSLQRCRQELIDEIAKFKDDDQP